MKRRDQFRARDIEKLSGLIDGELSKKETSRIEARLAEDLELRKILSELKATSELISSLPNVRPPRQFTLTEEMAGIRKGWNAYPVFRFAAVIATVAFAVLVGLDAALQRGLASSQVALEAPMVVEVEKVAEMAEPVEATEEMSLERVEISPEDAIAGGADASAPPSSEENFVLGTPVPEGLSSPTAVAEAFAAELPSEAPKAWVGEPTAVGAAPPAVSPTPLPEREYGAEPITPLRKIEIGFGSAAALLIALTLVFRRLR